MSRFSKLTELDSPVAVIDTVQMQANIQRMQARMNSLGVSFRPHVKTSKCLPVVQAQTAAGAQGITVSTLKEARYFFDNGIRNILYAVGIGTHKLDQVFELRRVGCLLTILTDSPEVAAEIGHFGKEKGETFNVMIEVDTDGHRSGLQPEQEALIETAKVLAENGMTIHGVLTHAGSSYELNTPEALRAMAEQERAGCVRAAERIRAAGLACPVVSVGSTPTALSATNLDGVTEVRAGVYVFFDLVMHTIGVCRMDELALSVLTRVTGHQKEKGWAITDAGWMAMSRDQGIKIKPMEPGQTQQTTFGYGQVCAVDGTILPFIMSSANQEHGIVSSVSGTEQDITKLLPVGTVLRILPNHACATGAQFPAYHAVDEQGNIAVWPRIYGW